MGSNLLEEAWKALDSAELRLILDKILEGRAEYCLYMNKEDYFSDFKKQSLVVMKKNPVVVEINERWQ